MGSLCNIYANDGPYTDIFSLSFFQMIVFILFYIRVCEKKTINYTPHSIVLIYSYNSNFLSIKIVKYFVSLVKEKMIQSVISFYKYTDKYSMNTTSCNQTKQCLPILSST